MSDDLKASDEAPASALQLADGFAIVQSGADAYALFSDVMTAVITYLGDTDGTAAANSDAKFATQKAMRTYMAAAIAALVASSPSTLDTLNELAAALGNDPNFATTLATSLGLKAPIASPALTGNPTAPTPSPGDNDTSIATTAFVAAAIAAAGGGGGTKTYAILTPMDSQPPASNYATLDTRNSILALNFDDTTDEATFWTRVMPEGASLGSGLKARIWWMAITGTSGNAKWGGKFERGTTDLDSDSFDTEVTAFTATSGTSGILVCTELTITTIDSIAAGETYRFMLTRKPSDTTNDTLSGYAQLVLVEIRSAA